MRLLIIFLLIGIESVAITSLDQSAKDTIPGDYTYFYEKGKRQATTGKVLLIGGAGLMGIGIVTFLYSFSNSRYDDTGILSVICLYMGLAAMLCSIPFGISGIHNKRKAARLSMIVKNENYYSPQTTSSTIKSYPALGLRIRL